MLATQNVYFLIGGLKNCTVVIIHLFSFLSSLQYLGGGDIEDYRNKRETSAIMADLKRRSSKAPKPKAIIIIFTKELIVMDEKSKVHSCVRLLKDMLSLPLAWAGSHVFT